MGGHDRLGGCAQWLLAGLVFGACEAFEDAASGLAGVEQGVGELRDQVPGFVLCGVNASLTDSGCGSESLRFCLPKQRLGQFPTCSKRACSARSGSVERTRAA